jgi:uncharacterized membrane protein YbhN (UPF0104 family)
MVWRWKIILRTFGIELSWRRGIYVTLLSAFVAQFSPSGIGGDISRGALIFSGGGRARAVVTSIVLDRLYGLLTIVFFAVPPAIAAIVAPTHLSYRLGWLVLGFAALCVVGLGVTPRLSIQLAGRFPASTGYFRSVVEGLAEALAGIGETAFGCLSLSIVIQAAAVAFIVMIGVAVGLAIPIWAYLLVVPLVWLVTSLPVSLGGIGVREASFVTLLPAFGVTAADALKFGILVSAISIVTAATGALVALLARQIFEDTTTG